MDNTVQRTSGSSGEKLSGDVYASRRFQLSVTPHGYELVGASFKQPIVSGINVSQCGRWNHQAPDPYCTCGFYAYDNTKRQFPIFGVGVDAVVRFSGKVIVADEGLRAERMEIVAVSSTKSQVREKLQDTHSVATFATRDEMFAEYPITEFERTKSTLFQAAKWETKKLTMEFRNWVRDCGPSFITRTASWAIVLAFGILMMHAQADTLPEGYGAYSAILVAVQLIALWGMIKLPWVLTFFLTLGIGLAGNDLFIRFHETLEGLNLLEVVGANYAFLFLGGIFALAVRTFRFRFDTAPQVRARIMSDGKMPVVTYLPGESEEGAKNG